MVTGSMEPLASRHSRQPPVPESLLASMWLLSGTSQADTLFYEFIGRPWVTSEIE
jgi:hypothetical protein